MMYPRLKLLHRLLAKNGVIFISIDDNEVHHMRLIADEVFGAGNFIANIAAITNLKGRNDKKHVAACHEYILIYANREFISQGLPLTEAQRAAFKFVDEDNNKYALRDLRKRGGPDQRKDRPNMFFPLYWNAQLNRFFLARSSQTDIEIFPIRSDGSEGRWRWGREKIETHLAWLHPKRPSRSKRWGIEHRIYLDPTIKLGGVTDAENEGEDENDEGEDAVAFERTSKPKSFWLGGEFSSDAGKRLFKEILPEEKFDFPKSVDLIQRCIQMGSPRDGLVLDSFAGTGTTAHAVLKLNAEDGGSRRFILIETLDYAEKLTAERVRRVMAGYGEGTSAVTGSGGSFDYYTVGERLLREDGMLNPSVGLPAIRDYVAWTEGVPIGQCAPLVPIAVEGNASSPYWLGETHGLGVFFVWEDSKATTLDLSLLTELVKQPGRYLIYADQCALGEDFMRRHGIIYKKIPRDITRL